MQEDLNLVNECNGDSSYPRSCFDSFSMWYLPHWGGLLRLLRSRQPFPDKREISLGIRQLLHNKNRASGAFQNFLIEVL